MRQTVLGLCAALALAGVSSAAELKEKDLVGKWVIDVVGPAGPEKDRIGGPNKIELKEDGTFTSTNLGQKKTGKYKLKGKTLVLTDKDGYMLLWDNLSIKDGKVIQPFAGNKDRRYEWTKQD
jgi:hypothetical protein